MIQAIMSFFGLQSKGRKSGTLNVKLNYVVPPHPNGRLVVGEFAYTPGGTAHTLTALRSLGETTLSATAAASQAVIAVRANPGPTLPTANLLAANDYVLIRNDDGSFLLDTVSAVTALSITLANNLSQAIKADAKLWMLGISTDTDPKTGEPHPSWTTATAAQVVIPGSGSACGIAAAVAALGNDQPIVLQSDNATTTGAWDKLTFMYEYGSPPLSSAR